MKTTIYIIFSVVLICFLSSNSKVNTKYNEGDVIFQTTSGATGKGIQLATHSKYNHCGILFLENNKWVVYEAIQPVCKTSLIDFNSRGLGIIKRINTHILSSLEIEKLKAEFKKHENKNYDDVYGWGDDKIYCSELVYKLFYNALNIELCKTRKIGDYDFSHPLVKEKLLEKYGNNIPLNETMVAPSDLFESNMLSLIK